MLSLLHPRHLFVFEAAEENPMSIEFKTTSVSSQTSGAGGLDQSECSKSVLNTHKWGGGSNTGDIVGINKNFTVLVLY